MRSEAAKDRVGPIDVLELLDRAARLGFHDDDVSALRAAAPGWLADPDHRDTVGAAADRLRGGIGDLTVGGPDPWEGWPDGPDDGLGPMLSLLASADDVVAYQRTRGIEEPQAWRNLADLGQQVWVHRLTYGRFGLHTQGWLRIAWAGGFAWLGRLQFNLQFLDDSQEWVLSTHIPRSGPLVAEAVDEALDQATGYFAAHYPDVATTEFWCDSWLLAPELAGALPGSNIAAFQQRWALEERVGEGDADALFFTFARRSPVDTATLPRDTSLQRAVLDRLAAGDHWPLRRGRIAQFSTERLRS